MEAVGRHLFRLSTRLGVRSGSKKAAGEECPTPSRDPGEPGPCKSPVTSTPVQKSSPPPPARPTICNPKEVCELWHFDEHPGIFRSDACGGGKTPTKRLQVCCPDPPSEDHLPPGETSKKNPLDKMVVILGAGLSGLSTAAELIRRGAHNVTVLEASGRPGGRIRSCWLKNSVVELGASWRPVYRWDNPLMDAAASDGLMTVGLSATDPTHGLFQGPDGHPMPLLSSLGGYSAVREILKDAEKAKERLTGVDKGAILDFIGTRLQQAIRRAPSSIAVPVSRAMVGTVNAVCSRYSSSRGLVDNDQFGAYVSIPGSLVHIPLGFMGAVGSLMKDLPPERILYNKEVTVVRWGTVTMDQSPRAVVRCTDGSEYPADYVVVTCPLGVLKDKAEQMFCPYLSSRKLSAVRITKYGHANKIFIHFEEPFHLWRKQPINYTWRKDETEGRGGWLGGLRWLRPVRGSEHMLCMTVFGQEARILETKSEAELCRDARAFLQGLLGEPDLPKMSIAGRTNWSSDRLFLGAYTELEAPEGLQWDLSEPVPFPTDLLPPVIYFGGEATFVGVNSTLHSALIRGVQVADLVAKVMLKYPTVEKDDCQERKQLWDAVRSDGRTQANKCN